jgi:hypothetical protein
LSNFGLLKFSLSDTTNQIVSIIIRKLERKSFEQQKGFQAGPSDPFVAIQKRMVTAEVKNNRCRLQFHGRMQRLTRYLAQRLAQGTLESRQVTHSGQATIGFDLICVQFKHKLERQNQGCSP